ncbi:MAG TPA: 2-C-methyl-D-erythritol 2,4-cyclodiphosphate synthase [Clostridiales bacterium]|nr:2-C-methyl-D-erythritol 2,4-cyclodiphosphate synthase [Clostridiales bacterium]
MVSVIITCAGIGQRADFGYNKLLKDIGGATPFEKSLAAFLRDDIGEIIVTYNGTDGEKFALSAEKLGAKIKLVRGGKTRTESVGNGLEEVAGDIVLVHDGARPFVSADTITDCIKSAEKYGTGIAAVPAKETVAETDENGNILCSAKKNRFILQTPQAFKTEILKKAYSLKEENEVFPDESSLVGKYVMKCRVAKGAESNVKLTFKEDFSPLGNFFAGTGFDLHVFAYGRKLILGGIEIPYEKGLLGHSDADVLLHAITDAFLSSASLPDIGRLFPDDDPEYEGIDSAILLKRALALLSEKGYTVKNASAVIMAQKPKLAGYVEKIKENVAALLGIEKNAVGITCTTLEGIGTVGREEGIAVQAYCLTEKYKDEK